MDSSTFPIDSLLIKHTVTGAWTERTSEDDRIGMDIHCPVGFEAFCLPPGGKVAVASRLALSLAAHHIAYIVPHPSNLLDPRITLSPLFVTYLDVGELFLKIENLGDESIWIGSGQRLARLRLLELTDVSQIRVVDACPPYHLGMLVCIR